jgi:hypothetical protein
VHIALGYIWQFKIDDMTDVINIDPTGRDVRRYKNPQLTGAKTF